MHASTLLSHWLPSALLYVLSPATLVLGLVLNTRDIAAPYGRHSGGARHAAWGPLLNGRVAWMTQELPALAVPLMMMLAWRGGSGGSSTGPCTALGAAFVTHYAYRSLVYPLRIRGVKGTALTVWLMAVAFTTLNGFIQG
jgi:3-oxo-5-alpha-steroid 4-dehydrogenase 1